MVSSAVTADKCLEYAMSVSSILTNPLEMSLQHKQAWLQDNKERSGHRWGIMIESCSCFVRALCSNGDQKVTKNLLHNILQLVVQPFLILPEHEELRNKTLSYVHQMILVLPEASLNVISHILSLLLLHCNPNDVASLIQLMTQITSIYKENCTAFFNQFLCPIVQKVSQCIGTLGHALQQKTEEPSAAYSQDRQVVVHIERCYYLLIKSLFKSNLGSVLHSENNVQILPTILETLLTGFMSSDIPTSRTCVSTLQDTVQHWARELGPDRALADSQLCQLVFQQIPEHTFQLILRPSFNLLDAKTSLLLRDIASMQLGTAQMFGQAYTNSLQNFLANTLQCPPQLIEQYLSLLMQPATALQLKQFLKDFVNHSRGIS